MTRTLDRLARAVVTARALVRHADRAPLAAARYARAVAALRRDDLDAERYALAVCYASTLALTRPDLDADTLAAYAVRQATTDVATRARTDERTGARITSAGSADDLDALTTGRTDARTLSQSADATYRQTAEDLAADYLTEADDLTSDGAAYGLRRLRLDLDDLARIPQPIAPHVDRLGVGGTLPTSGAASPVLVQRTDADGRRYAVAVIADGARYPVPEQDAYTLTPATYANSHPESWTYKRSAAERADEDRQAARDATAGPVRKPNSRKRKRDGGLGTPASIGSEPHPTPGPSAARTLPHPVTDYADTRPHDARGHADGRQAYRPHVPSTPHAEPVLSHDTAAIAAARAERQAWKDAQAVWQTYDANTYPERIADRSHIA